LTKTADKIIKVGDNVFYPGHGVAKVTGVEEHAFGDIAQEFFILELERGGKSMVPTTHRDELGLRPLVSARKARALLKQVIEEPELDDSVRWKDRAQAYTERLKSGAPERYTEVLQELLHRAKNDRLSATEQRLLDTARSFFVGEVGEALSLAPEKVEERLAAVSQ